MIKQSLFVLCTLLALTSCGNRYQKSKSSDMASMYKAEREAINYGCYRDYGKNGDIDPVRSYLPSSISKATPEQLSNRKKPTKQEKKGVEAYKEWLTKCASEKADMNRKEGIPDSINSAWQASLDENKRLLDQLSNGKISYGEYLTRANKLLQNTKLEVSAMSSASKNNSKNSPLPPKASVQNAKDRRNATSIQELLKGDDNCPTPKNSREIILCQPLSRNLSDLTPQELERYKELVKQQPSAKQKNGFPVITEESIDMGPPLICGRNVQCHISNDVARKLTEKINFLKKMAQNNPDYVTAYQGCELVYKQLEPLSNSGRDAYRDSFVQHYLDQCNSSPAIFKVR